MFTCDQILTRLTALGELITAANYHQLAAQIHPPCHWLDLHKHNQPFCDANLLQTYDKLLQLPEVIEATRALDIHTSDYSDLALRLVVLWQANAAKMRWWLDNVAPQTSSEEIQAETPPFDHQAIANSGTLWVRSSRQRRFRFVLPVPRIIGQAPPEPKHYHLTVSLSTGDGNQPLFQTALHTSERYTATSTYAKLLAALSEEMWRFAMDYEKTLEPQLSTSKQSRPEDAQRGPRENPAPLVPATNGAQPTATNLLDPGTIPF